MFGTLINIVAVVVGSMLGLTIGGRVTEKMRETILHGLGLVTVVIGMEMALNYTVNILIVMGSVLFGGLLGEWWDIETRLEALGAWLETRQAGRSGVDRENPHEAARFIQGFVTASLVFCVGPLTILGAIQDGLTGDFRLLAIKSMLDGFASLAFSASMGIGVLFATLTILVYQGGLSLLAAQADRFLTDPMVGEMTATGGVLIMGLGISSLLQIKKVRVGNFLPALLLAPAIVWGLTAAGLPVALSDLIGQ